MEKLFQGLNSGNDIYYNITVTIRDSTDVNSSGRYVSADQEPHLFSLGKNKTKYYCSV